MANLNALTSAIAALPGAIAACKTSTSAKIDALNAQIVALKADQVPQSTIDGLTAQVNAAVASVKEITALATA